MTNTDDDFEGYFGDLFYIENDEEENIQDGTDVGGAEESDDEEYHSFSYDNDAESGESANEYIVNKYSPIESKTFDNAEYNLQGPKSDSKFGKQYSYDDMNLGKNGKYSFISDSPNTLNNTQELQDGEDGQETDFDGGYSDQALDEKNENGNIVLTEESRREVTDYIEKQEQIIEDLQEEINKIKSESLEKIQELEYENETLQKEIEKKEYNAKSAQYLFQDANNSALQFEELLNKTKFNHEQDNGTLKAFYDNEIYKYSEYIKELEAKQKKEIQAIQYNNSLEKESLVISLETAQKSLGLLEKQLFELGKLSQGLESLNQGFVMKIKQLEDGLEDSKKIISSQKEEISDLEKENYEIKNESIELQKGSLIQINQLQAEVDSLIKINEAHEANISSLKDKLEDKEEESQNFKNILTSLKDQLEGGESESDRLNSDEFEEEDSAKIAAAKYASQKRLNALETVLQLEKEGLDKKNQEQASKLKGLEEKVLLLEEKNKELSWAASEQDFSEALGLLFDESQFIKDDYIASLEKIKEEQSLEIQKLRDDADKPYFSIVKDGKTYAELTFSDDFKVDFLGSLVAEAA